VLKVIAVLAAVGTLALVVGCGGEDSTVSKQEYDQKLELACNKGLQEREEMLEEISQKFEEGGRKTSKDFQSENLIALIALYEGTTEEIADIGVPEEGEQEAEELVQAREDAAAKVQDDPLGSIDSLITIFAEANKLAEDLEAKSCAV
jgi:hypothetical protein